jgi:hypothetical protein
MTKSEREKWVGIKEIKENNEQKKEVVRVWQIKSVSNTMKRHRDDVTGDHQVIYRRHTMIGEERVSNSERKRQRTQNEVTTQGIGGGTDGLASTTNWGGRGQERIRGRVGQRRSQEIKSSEASVTSEASAIIKWGYRTCPVSTKSPPHLRVSYTPSLMYMLDIIWKWRSE